MAACLEGKEFIKELNFLCWILVVSKFELGKLYQKVEKSDIRVNANYVLSFACEEVFVLGIF